ncbi:PREDICTED: formin-binding protein 4-like isoform X3 [Priapulus caudatus]|uniref:Formin-binding protein 4-like isoform X2 n=1 Tax=Priapulus caudatus TaxID=37621 RepID=A0ABM1DVQ3_PRICU|nr:PREDICTED: formin-binding protein 4-like isoform X2 [Priapulus caudatus]XP_014664024.1 PREDICTED: formin-binding protein 4-like isoform X3 [Priapulus caudatus]
MGKKRDKMQFGRRRRVLQLDQDVFREEERNTPETTFRAQDQPQSMFDPVQRSERVVTPAKPEDEEMFKFLQEIQSLDAEEVAGSVASSTIESESSMDSMDNKLQPNHDTVAAAGNSTESTSHVSTMEWKQIWDDNVCYYYYWNTVTNAVTWEMPEDYARHLEAFGYDAEGNTATTTTAKEELVPLTGGAVKATLDIDNTAGTAVPASELAQPLDIIAPPPPPPPEDDNETAEQSAALVVDSYRSPYREPNLAVGPQSPKQSGSSTMEVVGAKRPLTLPACKKTNIKRLKRHCQQEEEEPIGALEKVFRGEANTSSLDSLSLPKLQVKWKTEERTAAQKRKLAAFIESQRSHADTDPASECADGRTKDEGQARSTSVILPIREAHSLKSPTGANVDARLGDESDQQSSVEERECVETSLPLGRVPVLSPDEYDVSAHLPTSAQLSDSNFPFKSPHTAVDGSVVPVEGPQLPVEGPQLPVVGPQLPVEGPQLPVVGPQLPVEGPQLPVVGPQLPVEGPQLPVVGPQLPVDGPQLPVVGHQLPAEGPQLPVIGPQLPVEGPQLPVIGPQLPVEGPQLPVIGPHLSVEGPQLPVQEGSELAVEGPELPPKEADEPTDNDSHLTLDHGSRSSSASPDENDDDINGKPLLSDDDEDGFGEEELERQLIENLHVLQKLEQEEKIKGTSTEKEDGGRESEEKPAPATTEQALTEEDHIDDIKVEVADLSSTITSKLEFLEISTQGLTQLQILLIQTQARLQDWREGGLKTAHFWCRLQDASQQLEQYEQLAAPPGWSCHWDRIYKRYFYVNEITGESQWVYPCLDDDDDDVSTEHATTKEPVMPPAENTEPLMPEQSSSRNEGEAVSAGAQKEDADVQQVCTLRASGRECESPLTSDEDSLDGQPLQEEASAPGDGEHERKPASEEAVVSIATVKPEAESVKEAELNSRAVEATSFVQPSDESNDYNDEPLPPGTEPVALRPLVPYGVDASMDDSEPPPPPLSPPSVPPPPPDDPIPPPPPEPAMPRSPPPPPPPDDGGEFSDGIDMEIDESSDEEHNRIQTGMPPLPPPPLPSFSSESFSVQPPAPPISLSAQPQLLPSSLLQEFPKAHLQTSISEPHIAAAPTIICPPKPPATPYISVLPVVSKPPELHFGAASSAGNLPAEPPPLTATEALTSSGKPSVLTLGQTGKSTKERKKKKAKTEKSLKKKGLSQLVQKWQKVREEEGESSEEEDANPVQKWIEDWKKKQLASGEAENNPNFEAVGMDWKERVRLAQSKANTTSDDKPNLLALALQQKK